MIKTAYHEKPYTVAANGHTGVLEISSVMVGYKLSGVIGYSTGNPNVLIQSIFTYADLNKISFTFRNVSSSSVSAKAEFRVMFVKEL